MFKHRSLVKDNILIHQGGGGGGGGGGGSNTYHVGMTEGGM